MYYNPYGKCLHKAPNGKELFFSPQRLLFCASVSSVDQLLFCKPTISYLINLQHKIFVRASLSFHFCHGVASPPPGTAWVAAPAASSSRSSWSCFIHTFLIVECFIIRCRNYTSQTDQLKDPQKCIRENLINGVVLNPAGGVALPWPLISQHTLWVSSLLKPSLQFSFLFNNPSTFFLPPQTSCAHLFSHGFYERRLLLHNMMTPVQINSHSLFNCTCFQNK